MMKRILGVALAGLIALGVSDAPRSLAAITTQQRTKAKAAETALKKAASLNKAQKYKEAGEELKRAQTAIGSLGSDPDAAKLIAPLYKQLASLHGDLELQGVKLDPLPAEPAAPAEPAGKSGGAASGVSFTKQVAPMLVAKCSKCHIQGNKGNFSVASYSALMRGSADGTVISPKSADGSRIVEVIRSGDMPRGGGPVSPDEQATLAKWINEGALFDGKNRDANIADGSAGAGGDDAGSKNEPVAMATGKETINFALDIAPVLVEHCVECHGEGRNLRGQFNMSQFRGLLKGGFHGDAVSAGRGAASLIIQKLKGTAKDGEQMPQGKEPLSKDVIAKFEKWIDEGAKFSGFDVNAKIRTVAAVAHAETITPEQLAKEREELGARNWKLILPDGGDDREETENFVVFGNTGKESLKEIAKIAEAQGAKLQKALRLPSGPLMKGRTNIYVFDKKYDYGEVGHMLEGRELPPDQRGHWNYTVVDSYICLVPPKNNEYSLSGLIGQQVAGVLVASQGNAPHWFAEGSARNLIARLEPKDPRTRGWDDQAREALSGGTKPDGFLAGSGPDNDAVAYSFVKFLMSDSKSYQKLIAAAHNRARFDEAFQQAYGAPPAQAAARWGGR